MEFGLLIECLLLAHASKIKSNWNCRSLLSLWVCIHRYNITYQEVAWGFIFYTDMFIQSLTKNFVTLYYSMKTVSFPYVAFSTGKKSRSRFRFLDCSIVLFDLTCSKELSAIVNCIFTLNLLRCGLHYVQINKCNYQSLFQYLFVPVWTTGYTTTISIGGVTYLLALAL